MQVQIYVDNQVCTRTHAYRLCPLKPAVHYVSYTLTHTPVIAVPAFWQQRNVCDVINFHSVCREERRQTAFRGEKWVPCVECWTSAPVLWPVKGKCLKVWGDMNLPECGWGESCCEGVGTYFKTWLFVLVKAYGDSSTTGDLSWTQPSRLGIGGLIKHTPSLVAPGAPGAGLLYRLSSHYRTDWSHTFLFHLTLFLCAALLLPLSQRLCLFCLVPLPPKKPQECCMAARKKKGHASFTVSPPLSAVPE